MHAFTGNFWAAAAAKSLQLCLTLCDPKTAVHQALPSLGFSRQEHFGCHFLFQCVKVKSEREVVQLCLTLSHPKDCSLPGSSVHRILQARVLEWGAIAFSICPPEQHLISPHPVPPVRKFPQASYPHPSEGRQNENHNYRKLTNWMTWITALSNSMRP